MIHAGHLSERVATAALTGCTSVAECATGVQPPPVRVRLDQVRLLRPVRVRLDQVRLLRPARVRLDQVRLLRPARVRLDQVRLLRAAVLHTLPQ